MEHASGITSSITPLALIERAATKKTSAKRLTAPLYHFAQQTEVPQARSALQALLYRSNPKGVWIARSSLHGPWPSH